MAEPQYHLLLVNTEDDALVLTIAVDQVEGETVSLALQSELLAATKAAGTGRVIVDFQNVRYISSVAFGPLLALRRHLNGIQGRLIVCGLNSMVGDIFYTTKMVDPTGKLGAPFEMRSDVPAALTAMKSPPADMPAS